MSPTRRQLKSLIEEIRREDIMLDQAGDAILSRWENDDNARRPKRHSGPREKD
jgi:hypothetical protein